MLERVAIKDFVIVEQLDLEVLPGLTVLTGETGAGKSILLDALGFVLGDRADSGAVRPGSERADISAVFRLARRSEAFDWLRERELDADEECVLRRTLGQDGRSRGYINGHSVPVQSLRELGDLLVDIHGQNAHQWLLKSAAQRRTLDDYAAHDPLVSKVASGFTRWQQLQQEFSALSSARADRDARLDLLRYQVQELQALELGDNEIDELNHEHARLANASRLLQGCERALQLLLENDDSSVTAGTDQVIGEIETLTEFDAQLAPALEMLNSAGVQLHEAARELRSYRDRLDLDPERLSAVEDRLAVIHDLARKHRADPAELPALHARLASELAQLEHADVRLDELRTALDAAAADYRAAAKALSTSRRKAAKKLAQEVTHGIQDLGMKGGSFEIRVDDPVSDEFSMHGLDRIEFLVTANPGQPPRPLNKVASGGELSRISLAIEVATAQTTGIPTLVFDEVDAGVGGGVAEIVGRRLRALAKRRQILCVTHLPQVAAQGQQHWAVSKQSRNGSTRSSIALLEENERIEEVARMLGGVKVTAQTKAHAQEMLHHARAS